MTPTTSTTSKKTMRKRAMTIAGGIALIGTTGAGLASGATAATNSSTATSTLAKIKYCESGGNYQAVNSSTGASGAYQFLNSTWKGLSAGHGYATAASAPASVQDAAALELYNQAGTSPWAASSGCWSHLGNVSSTTSTTSASSTSTTTTASTTASTSTTSSHQASAARTASAPKQSGTAPTAHRASHVHEPQRAQHKPEPKHVGSVCGHTRHQTVHAHPMKKPANRLPAAA